MCILLPCATLTEEGVWWRDDKQWCLYSANHQALIRRGIANNLQQIELGTIVSNVHPEGARYVVNLQTQEQVAVSSGQRRPVMIIDATSAQTPQLEAPPEAVEGARKYFVANLVHGQPVLSSKPPVKVIAEVPWDAAAMASLAAKADQCLRRKILVMVIDRFRSDEHLDNVLPLKACPWKIVSKNASTCSGPMYKKFVDSVEEILQVFPGDILGDMIKMSGGSREVENGPVQIVFKLAGRSSSKFTSCNGSTGGTKVAAFWMSMAAAAHAVVDGCTMQILAYLVVLPLYTVKKFSKIGDESSGYVEVDRPEHQLPLAEVTVR